MQKISPEKKEAIRADFATGKYSFQDLALKYLVSHSMCHYICNPEKLATDVKNRHGISREQNTINCRKYRQKKAAEKKQGKNQP